MNVNVQDQTVPLYGKIVEKYNKLPETNARQSAFHKFQLLGFPTIKHEDWKYTNITRFLKDEYALEATVTEAPKNLLAKANIPDLEAYKIVLVNGAWNGEITGGPLPKGIEITRVKETAAPSVKDWGNQHFANLNEALYTDGLSIQVTGVIEKPLHIVHLYASDHNLLIQPRHIITLKRNAEVSIVESIHSEAANAKLWVNGLTEIFLDTDAKMDHVNLQLASEGARLVHQTTIHQKKQSLYNNYTFTLPGADLVRNDLQARLEEDHTETHLYGLYLAAGDQLVDNHTLVDHQKPHCFSNELYKGVMLDQSTGVFNGKVYVHRDAQKTNAFQQNNNLVISKKATIDSKPELVIFADDVKCSHGSTVGQFSDEALFYLRARGIGEAAAKALLITAFAFDVTDKIKQASVAEYINQQISHHIPVNHAG